MASFSLDSVAVESNHLLVLPCASIVGMMKQYLSLIKRSLLATREMGFVIEMTYQFSAMHMAAMLDYECLNCCWVNAHYYAR